MSDLRVIVTISETGDCVFEVIGQAEATLRQIGLAVLYLEKAKRYLLDLEEAIEPDMKMVIKGEGDE
ncbi:hypothetical protein TK1358 [Thermococcus kodakarensis KOD1]|uniref:Uncharacterized protein n=1 Tax=Thermococcus kodakarensis (strain ATCC BAA-918 / JCM 12380 / KOD1) TaxID=69014 RepID=Q5JGW4_THEKO|nr:hypothetical protein [Thermococcus kodakarensis]WCN27337.1 hypothetical protein POG15_06900 [Thermococcus kodakarensis]WCN29626.1 hypothetical protein POG21_06895 [Thermococcus kodakarensis]BAD85547.1 hypothetical protein TK1358 [Thermococcus kodakarensis KOD1]